MKRVIEIVPYDARWIARFEEEASLLRSVFGEEVVATHHIGSTSIPGMMAKPIIDVLLEVHDIDRVDAFNEAMSRLGYEARGEYGLPRRRYFPKTVGGQRMVHVHTWASGDLEIERHLAFRDFMIAHPLQAEAYGYLKRDLVKRYAGDNEAYIAGKHDFCVAKEQQAMAWQGWIRSLEIRCERLRLIPLSAAQLEFLLSRPDQLEAELGLSISRLVTAPPVVRQAIRLKKYRIVHTAAEEFRWHTYWLAVVTAEGFGAGLIGFKGVPDAQGKVEIGYGIDPDYRRKGYTTEATRALIKWAFTQPSCQAVTAWSDKDNRASGRVLEKVGMRMWKETSEQYGWVMAK